MVIKIKAKMLVLSDRDGGRQWPCFLILAIIVTLTSVVRSAAIKPASSVPDKCYDEKLKDPGSSWVIDFYQDLFLEDPKTLPPNITANEDWVLASKDMWDQSGAAELLNRWTKVAQEKPDYPTKEGASARHWVEYLLQKWTCGILTMDCYIGSGCTNMPSAHEIADSIFIKDEDVARDIWYIIVQFNNAFDVLNQLYDMELRVRLDEMTQLDPVVELATWREKPDIENSCREVAKTEIRKIQHDLYGGWLAQLMMLGGYGALLHFSHHVDEKALIKDPGLEDGLTEIACRYKPHRPKGSNAEFRKAANSLVIERWQNFRKVFEQIALSYADARHPEIDGLPSLQEQISQGEFIMPAGSKSVLEAPGEVREMILKAEKAKLVETLWADQLCYMRCGYQFTAGGEPLSYKNDFTMTFGLENGEQIWCQPACWLKDWSNSSMGQPIPLWGQDRLISSRPSFLDWFDINDVILSSWSHYVNHRFDYIGDKAISSNITNLGNPEVSPGIPLLHVCMDRDGFLPRSFLGDDPNAGEPQFLGQYLRSGPYRCGPDGYETLSFLDSLGWTDARQNGPWLENLELIRTQQSRRVYHPHQAWITHCQGNHDVHSEHYAKCMAVVTEDLALRDEGYTPQQIACYMCQTIDSSYAQTYGAENGFNPDWCGNFVRNAECPGFAPGGHKILWNLYKKPKYKYHGLKREDFCQTGKGSPDRLYYEDDLSIGNSSSTNSTDRVDLAHVPGNSTLTKRGHPDPARIQNILAIARNELDLSRKFARDELILCEKSWLPLIGDQKRESRLCVSMHGGADLHDTTKPMLASPTITGQRVLELLEAGSEACGAWPYLAIPVDWPANKVADNGVLIVGGVWDNDDWRLDRLGMRDGRDCSGVCNYFGN